MRKHRNDRTRAPASMGTEDRIRQRAYERYRERGGEHGHDMDDWFEAEREVERNSPLPEEETYER